MDVANENGLAAGVLLANVTDGRAVAPNVPPVTLPNKLPPPPPGVALKENILVFTKGTHASKRKDPWVHRMRQMLRGNSWKRQDAGTVGQGWCKQRAGTHWERSAKVKDV